MKKTFKPSGHSQILPETAQKPRKTMRELYPNLPSLPDYEGRPRYRPHAYSVAYLRSHVIEVNTDAVDGEISSGTLCFSGSHIPVSVLFSNLANGLRLEDILKKYPSLPRDLAIQALEEAGRLLAEKYKNDT